ncbi:MAG TPA: GNAT family N-acetyltransferase [Vicinamibacterales bacterium]|nr:GNAT family N-acetyltransferase [Vicinamibacterales bacterium]
MTDHDETDEALDETLEETFPASDPPANTVETGVHVAQEGDPARTARAKPGPSSAPLVVDHVEAQQFEVTVDGEVGFLQYERRPGSLVLMHTEVPPALRGRQLGDLLAETAIDRAHAEGLQLVVVCPFVRAYLRKHPEKLAKT